VEKNRGEEWKRPTSTWGSLPRLKGGRGKGSPFNREESRNPLKPKKGRPTVVLFIKNEAEKKKQTTTAASSPLSISNPAQPTLTA